MSYSDMPDYFRKAAGYADKILHGAKPADLPVEQPIRLKQVINLKVARAMGLTIPQSLLVTTYDVIESSHLCRLLALRRPLATSVIEPLSADKRTSGRATGRIQPFYRYIA